MRRTSTLLLATILVCASCAGPGVAPDTQTPRTPVARPAAMASYREAHGHWVRAHTAGGASMRDELEEALRELDFAHRLDPRSPLFRGLAGDVHVQLAHLAAHDGDERSAQAHLQRADDAYRQSLATHSQWVHGHIGLAQLARLDERYEDARQHLDTGAKELALAIGLRDPNAPNLFVRLVDVLVGIDLEPRERAPDLLQVEPTPEQGREVLLRYLAETEKWTLDHRPSQGGGAVDSLDGLFSVDPKDLLVRFVRRLRLEDARIVRDEALSRRPADASRAWARFLQDLDTQVLHDGRDLVDAQLDPRAGAPEDRRARPGREGAALPRESATVPPPGPQPGVGGPPRGDRRADTARESASSRQRRRWQGRRPLRPELG
jgi:hypothetical protein